MNPMIRFDATEEGMKLMATFIAQLVREGVTYTVHEPGKRTADYCVEMLGGF